MNRRFVFSTCLVSTLCLLSGCSSLNSQFDCPMKPGVTCKSLYEVNTLIDQGKLGSHSSHTDPIVAQSRAGMTRVWIAPFEDKDGNYYGSTIVYPAERLSREANPSAKRFQDAGGDL